MTRTTTDTIVGIVGAIAIVFTLIGVFAYEYNNAPDDDTEEPTNQIPSQQHSGSLAQGDSFDANFTPSEDVMGISIRIQWTPTAPAESGALATYSYELFDPEGNPIDTGARTTGTTISVAVPVDGEYILTIAAESPSLGGDYTITATYDY